MAITPFYYNKTIRRIVVLFGTLFNEYYIEKSDGVRVKVPLQWAAKSKWFVKLKDAIETKKLEAITYPRMSFVITNIAMDLARKTSPLNQFSVLDPDNPNSMFKVNFPTPVTIDFSLYIGSKTIDEGLQILEQIVPYFDPTFNVTINELNDFEIDKDIPITLNGIQFDDAYEGSFDGQEVMIWDLSFSVEANLYKNYSSQSIIKKVVVDLNIMSDAGNETVKDRLIQQVDPFTAVVTDEWALLESWNLVLIDEEKFIMPIVSTVVFAPLTPAINTPVNFTVTMDSLSASVTIEFNNDNNKHLMESDPYGLVFTYTHPGFPTVGNKSFKLYVNKVLTSSYSGTVPVA